jgi:predicted transcriptional regulator
MVLCKGGKMIESLFGSKTRVKLLQLFLNNPNEAYYVREITRKIDEQINSVRRELKNLISVGIVKSRAVKNQLYYEANKDYKYYTPFRQIFSGKKSSEKDPVVDNELADFNALGDVKIVIQAGKLVGGQSDVDLLVAGDGINKTRLKLVVKGLEKDGASLNYVAMSYDDFYYRLSIRDRFVCDVLNKKHNVLIDTEGILANNTEEGEQ